MLKVKDLSLTFNKSPVIDSLTYEFEENKVTAVIGESGIGKTSLLNILCGLLKPTGGDITNDYKKIAVVFQEPRLFDWMTAEENVSTVSDKETAAPLLSKMGLADSSDKYPRELSGGMQQRVSLARVLAYDADLVILDEPFKGLDAEMRREISEFVFERLRGKTVIMITHDATDLEFADITLELTHPPKSELKLVKTNTSDTE